MLEDVNSTWNPKRLFSEIVMPAQCELIRMEYRGVNIDREMRDARRREFEKEIKNLTSDPILEGVNPWSPKQVGDKLREWKVTRAQTTNKKFLRRLRMRRLDIAPFINHVLRCREARKTKSTYLDAKLHPDGRLRTSYRLFVTETGRGRSGKDVFDLGTNLQNFPSSQRDWIIPDEGLVFWAADASQIEARIVAWLAQDESYIKAFLDGRDVHTENAVSMFGIEPEQVRNPVRDGSTWTWRDTGKRMSHAWGYWISAIGLVETVNDEIPDLGLTLMSAQHHIDSLNKLRPEVVKWRYDVVNRLKRSRVIVTPFGRPRQFLGPWRASDPVPNSLHREAIAHVPQSTAGDHMHRALVGTAARLSTIPDAECLLYTHDEIAGQCREEDVETVTSIACDEIARPMPLVWRGHILSCPADAAHGKSWQDAHP